MSIEEDRLKSAKALCLEGETEEAHAAHKDKLADAYEAFAASEIESNPAPQGVTQIDAHVLVTSEAGV